MSTRSLPDHWKPLIQFAESKGWNTCPFVRGGPICPMCKKECMCVSGYTEVIWVSPKAKYYHASCAKKRLEREYPNEVPKDE